GAFFCLTRGHRDAACRLRTSSMLVDCMAISRPAWPTSRSRSVATVRTTHPFETRPSEAVTLAPECPQPSPQRAKQLGREKLGRARTARLVRPLLPVDGLIADVDAEFACLSFAATAINSRLDRRPYRRDRVSLGGGTRGALWRDRGRVRPDQGRR